MPSPPRTKYSHLSDDELLNLVNDDRIYSPIIEELCKRLEALNGNHVSVDADHRAECPVCEAKLCVNYDEGNNNFTVEVNK